MIKIIESITDFFSWVIELFKTLGQIIVRFIGVLGQAVGYLKDVLSILPTWIYVILAVLIVVCVLYKVLGREGNA
jgi:hypothetical protein